MKKILLSGMFILTAMSMSAQNVAVGSNMEDETKWTVTQNVTEQAVYATVTFNFTDDIPTAGEGGAMRVTATNSATSNGTNVTIWQKVELQAGKKYVVDAAFKDLGAIANFWCQILLEKTEPVEGTDFSKEENCLGMINTWKTDVKGTACTYEGLDVTFNSWECNSGVKGDTIEIDQDTTYTFAIKMGIWNSAVPSTFDVVIDSLTITELNDEIPDAITSKSLNSFKVFTSDNTLKINNIKSTEMVSIYNILGARVKSVAYNNSVNISDLSEGMYVVAVGNKTAKFIKR